MEAAIRARSEGDQNPEYIQHLARYRSIDRDLDRERYRDM